LLAVFSGNDPIAIELDFVQPAGPDGGLSARAGWQGRMKPGGLERVRIGREETRQSIRNERGEAGGPLFNQLRLRLRIGLGDGEPPVLRHVNEDHVIPEPQLLECLYRLVLATETMTVSFVSPPALAWPMAPLGSPKPLLNSRKNRRA
jgi:hypothetical protein